MGHLGKNIVIAASLIGAGFMIAWLRFRPWLQDGAELTDGASIVETDSDALRFAIFDLPEAWSIGKDGERSRIDSAPTFSPDGRFAVFAGGMPGERKDLFVIEIEDGIAGEPELLSRANTPFDEVAPAFAGDRLWFASNRTRAAEDGKAQERRDFDLYVADFKNGEISEPRALPSAINTAADERDPAPFFDGTGVIFAANPAEGVRRDFDLFLAERRSGDTGEDWVVSRLNALCTPAEELEPHVSADRRQLVFASDREGGAGGFDLYRSVRQDSTFRAPDRITSLATTFSERSPRFQDDGFSLLFERIALNDPLATASLLRARSIELFRVPGKPIGWMEILFVLALLAMALLAWLAKRWETLDVLYKCFLVAIVVHLLLLWYSQRVPVDPKEMTLPKRDGLFRVQIASALSRADAKKERGGSLEVKRPSERVVTSAPTRADQLAREEALPSATPGSMQLERGEQATRAPAKSASSAERSEAAASKATVALADRGPELKKNTTAAPGFEVGGPRSTDTKREQRDSAGAPTRVAVATESSAERLDPSPHALSLDRGEHAVEIADARLQKALHEGNDAVAKQSADALDVAIAADAPVFSESRGAAPAPELSLDDLATGITGMEREVARGAPERATIGPSEASSAQDDAPSVAPSLAPLAVATQDDSPTPARGEADFTPEIVSGAAPDVEVTLATPTEAKRAASLPALPADHLVLEPVALSSERPSAATETSPRRFEFAATADATPAPAPTPLAFARAEPEHDAIASPTTTPFEHTPYKTRFGLEKEVALKAHGGSEETERAVAMGLRYLASQQTEDGCFGDAEFYDDKYGYIVVGKSGLCLLAFLGAGHTPTSNTEYSAVAARAVKFLLDVQTDSGHFGWTSAYSHGIATYALAECFALSKDDSLRPSIERGVRHILEQQSKARDPRNGGGWGYFNPDGPHFDKWSRVSVTSWQVMALESARLSGIDVPDAAFDRAKQFLVNSIDREHGYFRYNHDPDRLNSEYRTLPGSTPAGLFALALLGEDIAGEDYASERSFVLERAPKDYRWRGDDAFVHEAAANLYFWYYGSLALFRVGGEPWEKWNDGLKKALLPAQAKDGSWKPIDNYSQRAGDSNSSRCFTTAMNVLTLEVYYRYFTPLLKVK